MIRSLLSLSLLTGGLALAAAAPATAATHDCASRLASAIPARAPGAPNGTAAIDRLRHLVGAARDKAIESLIFAGNVPAFLRILVPVTFHGRISTGQRVKLTICVTPDYLAVGNDANFVRTPLGLPAAAQVALRFGFLLPTPRMVDAIYAQARVHLKPHPMPPTSAMVTTDYLLRHNATVDRQLGPEAGVADELVAGQKKDVVLTNRLRQAPGKVAIYGWHTSDGHPIQPLSTVHQEHYADYSHGIRLVSDTAYIDDKPVSLNSLLSDPTYASLLSSEGPIRDPEALLASYAH